VTILRERHPFEGRSLAVMSAIKRRGTLSLLVVLPDGSRALIPASWTDWTATAEEPAQSRPEHRDSCLASLADLLHARGIVDALLGRCLIPQTKPAADEESCDATDPGFSRTSPADATNAESRTARRRSTRRGAQDSGTHHRASLPDDKSTGDTQ
jgi:hypothetical protein